MITLIKFEFKKFFKRKKNIFGLIIFFILVLCYVLLNFNLEKIYADSEIITAQQTLKSCEEVSVSNVYSKKMASLLKEKITALQNGGWQQKLNAEIAIDKYQIYSQQHVQGGGLVYGENIDIIQKRIALNEILLKNNIPTIYTNCSMQAFNFLRLIGTDIIPFISIILLILLSSDIISAENEDGTFKLLLLQPISRFKILLSKYLANIFACVLSMIFIFGIFFFVLGIFKGFGSFLYPTSFFSGTFKTFGMNITGKTSFIPIYKILFYMAPMQIMLIITVVSFAMLISTIVKSTSTSVTICVITTVALYLFTVSMNIIKSRAPFVPLTYSNINAVLDGTLATTLQNSNITYSNGMIIMIFYTIFCFITSFLFFRKKDIIC